MDCDDCDLTQAIKAWLDNKIDDDRVHTGEDIPQFVEKDFVWFMRSGDRIDDKLNNPPDIIAAILDVEIVAKDINQCRLLTEQVKYLFRQYQDFEIEFTENKLPIKIASFDVENHDDSYVPHLVELDEKLHIGSFILTAYYG